jgi:GNAT superfamily N-acetyltransferase
MDLHFEPLDPKLHHRGAFSCGHERIDRYLREVAVQASERFSAKTFVLVEAGSPPDGLRPILGFFTLAFHEFRDKEMDPVTARALKVKNLGSVPAVLIGQLAVAKEWQNKKLGPMILRKALTEALRGAQILGGALVITDPVDSNASAFYEKFGFTRLLPEKEQLYLPMKTIAEAYGLSGRERGRDGAAFSA